MQSKYIQRQKGMSLLEVVVSMLIIGMGLGMSISMIQASNRYAETAENRAVALNEIQSIVSSMKSNKLGGPAYVDSAAKAPELCKLDCTDGAKLLEKGQEIAYLRAAADLATWKNNLSLVLPAGQGTITENNDLYTVTVTWRTIDENDMDEADNKVSETVQLTFPL